MNKPGSSENPIVLFGEYDMERRDELALTFRGIEPADELFIDLRDVEYVDSTFLSELGLLRKRYPELAVTLLHPRPHLQRILQLMEFDKIFRIRDSEAP